MKLKRTIALLLALLLTVSLFPAQALATETEQPGLLQTIASLFTGSQAEEEPEYICGQEAHVHEAGCYAQEPSCGQEVSEGHTHGEGCYGAEKTELTCTLSTEGHAHTDACKKTLTCTTEENHTHGETCKEVRVTDCASTEEGHVHSADCQTVTEHVICTKEEGHTHADACHTIGAELLCGQAEAEPHTHGDGCHTYPLTCTLAETQGHAHEAGCYKLTCEKQEHEHGEECLPAACPNCGETQGHLETCPDYSCPDCGMTGGSHNLDCEHYVAPVCNFCQQEEGHLEGCYWNPRPVSFGVNEPFRGAGSVLESAVPGLGAIAESAKKTGNLSANSDVLLFTANAALASIAEDDTTPANQIDQTKFDDGTVSGEKTVTSVGTVAGTDEPIYKINLTARTNSIITGQSCDFVLVLDMSYSMNNGDNLAQLKKACQDFVDHLYDISRFSRVAIVTYGGNTKGNQYFIRSAYDESYVLAVDDEHAPDGITEVGEGADEYDVYTAKANANDKNQLWTIQYNDDGSVEFQSLGQPGMSLNVTGGVISSKNPFTSIGVSKTASGNSQKWSVTVLEDPAMKNETYHDNYTYLLESKIPSPVTGKKCYVNIAGGKSVDGDIIVYPEEDSVSDEHKEGYISYKDKGHKNEQWIIEEAFAPSYETYYWTNSADPDGYGVKTYTDHSTARTAFLTVSKNGGTEKNDQLANAISALVAYGEPSHGSHPGEAMEKAQRIYAAVQDTDQCQETKEFYIESPRGVLYFADGTPTPSDTEKLNFYPNSQGDGYTRGRYYDFMETYNDAQDAMNWARILKYDRGVVLDDPNVEGDFYMNFLYGERLDDSLYAGAVGAGAMVYALSINLAEIDLTKCDKSSHSGKDCIWKTFTLDDNVTKVKVCMRKADSNEGDGLQQSFDSTSNEFFYRLSSHCLTSEHITYLIRDNPNDATPIQKAWNKGFIEAGLHDSSKDAGGWGYQYPDFICRNQPDGYFLACDDASNLSEKFLSIAVQTGKTLSNLVLTDNVTMAFIVTDAEGNPVPDGTEILPDGTIVTDKESDAYKNAPYIGVVHIDETTQKHSVIWSGFGLSPGDTNGANKVEFEAEFFVTPRPGFLGGNDVPSNEGATIVTPDGTQLGSYPNPEVDVVVPENMASHIVLEARAGSTYLESITYDDLLDLISLTIDNTFTLELGNENNYGLESWQNQFINIKYELWDTEVDAAGNQVYQQEEDENGNLVYVPQKDAQGNILTDAQGNVLYMPKALEKDKNGNSGEIEPGETLTEVRRNHAVIVKVWVWPKTGPDGKETSTTVPPEGLYTSATGVVTIRVHYPTFVFADEYLYYGQRFDSLWQKWENIAVNDYLHWYTDDEYDLMAANEADPEHGKFTVDQVKAEDFSPLPDSGKYNGIGDEPTIVFQIDPIDSKVPYTEKTESSVDEFFHDKFGDWMGKDDAGINVRVYFLEGQTQSPLRHAFFLHAIHTENATSKCKNITIHTSGGLVARGLDGKPAENMELLKEYWLPEFYIHPKYCQMTITKTGGTPGETYVFNVRTDADVIKQFHVDKVDDDGWLDYTTVSITVDENGEGSVTLYELPVGNYTVTEDTNWSWRHENTSVSWTGGASTESIVLAPDDAATAVAEDAVTVTFVNTKTNDSWLSGFSEVVKNVFGVAHN